MVAKRIKLDFSKVEERSGWSTNKMPEGLHEFKIVDVVDQEAQDGTDMYVFALVPTATKYKARRFPYYCKLQANQYWKLRDFLIAAGVPVPKAVGNVDPNKAVGKTIVGEVVDATGQYEGRSQIDGVYGKDILDGDSAPAGDEDAEDEEYEDAEEADEEDYDEEEEGDEEEEDLDALSLAELRKRAKGLGIKTEGLKKDALIDSIIEAEDEEAEEDEDEDDLDDEDLDDEEFEDDEEEEEEEPAPPVRRKAPAKAAPAAAPARRVVKRR